MGETKELNIKSEAYYFYDDMINIKIFNSIILKIDKKSYKDFDIYYVGYITIIIFDKFSDHENIHSVNPLYLLIHSATVYFKEKNDEKYLVFDLIDKYEEVFSGIIFKIETSNREKVFHEKHY